MFAHDFLLESTIDAQMTRQVTFLNNRFFKKVNLQALKIIGLFGGSFLLHLLNPI